MKTKTRTTNEILNNLDTYLNIRIKRLKECLNLYDDTEKDDFYYEHLAIVVEFIQLKHMISDDEAMQESLNIWNRKGESI